MLCCVVHLLTAVPGWHPTPHQVQAPTRLAANSSGQLVPMDTWAAIQLLFRASSAHAAMLEFHCSDMVYVPLLGIEQEGGYQLQ